MTVASRERKIDDMMEQASAALAGGDWFEAEALALKALELARSAETFDRMARIVMPLQEARRQRRQAAIDTGRIVFVDEPFTEETTVEPGCYVVRPPQVGADSRRLRLAALEQKVPVLVVCREPRTQLGLCPIVAICPGTTIRTRIDPPDDPEHPDMAWFTWALEELGDWAIASLDPTLPLVRRVDALLDRLAALPDHEKLHQSLEAACRDMAADVASKRD